MKSILSSISVYGIAYLVVLASMSLLLFLYPQMELHLLLNSWHTDVGDYFFKYFSVLAEWPLYIVALLPLLWRKYGLTLFFALSEVTAGVVVQILKHVFCCLRPIAVFEHHNIALPLVEGVSMHHGYSFPSGHASTFFVFFTCCALILAYYHQKRPKRNDGKTWGIINITMVALLLLASIGAYSRIYLSQHFLADVFVGSIIGFITPCLFFYFGRDKILKLNKE